MTARYFAERYDAELVGSKPFFVFDSENEGREVAGGFATLEEADAEAARLNAEAESQS